MPYIIQHSQTSDSQRQVLIHVRDALIGLGFLSPVHCRLSVACLDTANQAKHQGVHYQGLTRATNRVARQASNQVSNQTSSQVSNDVMIKWQLMPIATSFNATSHPEQSTVNPSDFISDKGGLAYEIAVIKHIQGWQTRTHKTSGVIPLWDDVEQVLRITQADWQLIGYVMPYCSLGSVKRYVKQHLIKSTSSAMTSDEYKVRLLLAMAKALQVVHQAGWIHGDIKPSNFLFASAPSEHLNPEIYVCDLGNAMPIGGVKGVKKKGIDEIGNEPRFGLKLTDEVSVFNPPQGTPAYLAPECWQGQPISVQSDVYAFGMTMLEVLSGKGAYQPSHELVGEARVQAWREFHLGGEVQNYYHGLGSPSSLEMPFKHLLDKCLAVSLDKRLKNISSLVEVIPHFLD